MKTPVPLDEVQVTEPVGEEPVTVTVQVVEAAGSNSGGTGD